MPKVAKQIPAGWKVMNFNEFIELSYGSNLPKPKREPGSFPVYGSNGITDYHNEHLVKGPGLIVGRKGSIGLVHWSESDFWPIDTTYYVVESENKNLKWIYYKLQTLGLEKMNTASGIPGLNRNEVYSLKIAVPPLSEQNRIVSVLSKVDEEIEKVDQIIEQTEKLKKGLMQKLLTRGIGHKKFKKSELGEIPEEWEVVRLSEIAIINPKTQINDIDDKVSVGFISMSDVSNSASIENIQERPLNEVLKGFTKFQTGDVLFAKITPCMENGKGGLLEDTRYPFYFGSTEFHIIRPTDKIMNSFIHFIVNSKNFREIAKGHMRGSAGQQRVPKEFLCDYKIPLPNLKEQEMIVKILSSTDNKILINQKIKSKLSKFKKGLMNDLLSGKVRTLAH